MHAQGGGRNLCSSSSRTSARTHTDQALALAFQRAARHAASWISTCARSGQPFIVMCDPHSNHTTTHTHSPLKHLNGQGQCPEDRLTADLVVHGYKDEVLSYGIDEANDTSLSLFGSPELWAGLPPAALQQVRARAVCCSISQHVLAMCSCAVVLHVAGPGGRGVARVETRSRTWARIGFVAGPGGRGVGRVAHAEGQHCMPPPLIYAARLPGLDPRRIDARQTAAGQTKRLLPNPLFTCGRGGRRPTTSCLPASMRARHGRLLGSALAAVGKGDHPRRHPTHAPHAARQPRCAVHVPVVALARGCRQDVADVLSALQRQRAKDATEVRAGRRGDE